MKIEKIDVSVRDGMRTIMAVVCGAWAAHPRVLATVGEFDNDEWTVTHMASGYQAPNEVVGHELSWFEAVAVAESLDREIGVVEISDDDSHPRIDPQWKHKMEAVSAAALGAYR